MPAGREALAKEEEKMQEVVISEQRKIMVQKREWKGRTSFDIRVYITTDKYTGYTPKGINIPVEKAKELTDAIMKEMET